MARNNRPPSSRSVKKRDTWDMLRGWQVNAIPDEEDETGIYCWGKRKTDVDPYTNFELWTKLYRGWDPFLCDITTKCTAIEDMSGFIDDSLDDHLKKDATRKRDPSSQLAVESGPGNDDSPTEQAETTAAQEETAREPGETAPGETEDVGSFSQAAADVQAEENGEAAETPLFQNEWAGTDSKKEVEETMLLSVRCPVRNHGSTPATVTLDPSVLPNRHSDPGAHAHDVRQWYGSTTEQYSSNDENRHLSYIRISKAYASVNDETESDNREDYTAAAPKPVRLQYTRSNVAYIPEAYHNGEAAYGYTGFVASSYSPSHAIYAFGKRCLNPQRGDANKPEGGDGCDVVVANGGGQWQNEARHLANGAADAGGEQDSGQVASHKHASLVLKKVTLQESGGDGDATHPVAPSPAQRPVSAVKGAKHVNDKPRPDGPARAADQQSRETRSNATKSGGGIVWPSGKHEQGYFSIRDLFPAVDKLNMRRSFPQRSSRPLGSVVIDDGNQRETKFGSKERLTSDTTRAFTMREGIEHLRQKERLQMPGGPPSFRPTKNRTPLHRAKEMTKKRMFGHWLPGGQGGDEIDIPARWQSSLGGSYSAPPEGSKLVNNGVDPQRRNSTRYTANYDTMGFGTDPGYSDTRSGRMQSVYESTLGSLYKLSRQRRHKLGWNQTTAALLQTHTQLDYELQGIARSRTTADKV